ncbi:MAG: hypothetical protein KAK00_08305 [Nanoarchaeota archaeon]|nr:hypothetical protein [Nanoarchaeota archaeon]
MKKLFALLTAFFLIFPFCYSLEYYIDEKITILENGDTNIQGTTNVDFLKDVHPINENIDGITSELTEKKGRYWLFSYNSGNISASFIEVRLPKGAIINHIKSPLSVNLASKDDTITATFFGENKNSNIKIQYSLANGSSNDIPIAFWTFIILIIIIAITLFILLGKKKELNLDEKKLLAIKPTLNETQVKIIDALLEKKGQASQTAIQYMTNIPKASLSRNIELLAQKELIQKFYNGTSNYIKIHPSLRK